MDSISNKFDSLARSINALQEQQTLGITAHTTPNEVEQAKTIRNQKEIITSLESELKLGQ